MGKIKKEGVQLVKEISSSSGKKNNINGHTSMLPPRALYLGLPGGSSASLAFFAEHLSSDSVEVILGHNIIYLATLKMSVYIHHQKREQLSCPFFFLMKIEWHCNASQGCSQGELEPATYIDHFSVKW